MHKSILLGGFGGALILIAAILGFVVFPNVRDNQIKKELRLTRGSTVWNKWVDIDSAIYLNFYIFHITNPDEVDQGAAPKLKQEGPYVYRQRRQKVDPRSENCKDTVKYEQRTTYFFDQIKSGDRKEDDVVNIINVPFISVITATPPAFAGVVAGILSTEKIVRRNVKVGEVIFQGFDVSIYNHPIIAPQLPEEFSDFLFGLYKGRNGSTDGLYEVYTGTQNVDYFGIVKSWNGNTKLPFWNETKCNDLSGTDGTIFPPFLKKDRIIKIFNTDLCRALELSFKEEVEVKGVKGYRFTPTAETLQGAATNQNNACFCRKQDKMECQNGVIDVGVCRNGAPIVLSTPHFLDGYEGYASYSGLKPERKEHETILDIEPKTGLLLAAHKRIQINVEVRKIENVPQLENVTGTALFPAAWIDEQASICDVDVNDFKDRVEQPTKSVNIAKWTVIGIGIACVLVAAALPIAFKKSKSSSSV